MDTADPRWTPRTLAAAEGARQGLLDAAHARNAARLKALLFANRGIYIKLGQHMGLLDYLLPPEYVGAMRGCFDAAPASPWSAVVGTLRRELGAGRTEPIVTIIIMHVHTTPHTIPSSR